jgi:hypothetical protein
MNAFIFVSIVCISSQCDFFTSTVSMEKPKCELMRKNFLELPFKPEVTYSGAACMPFSEGTKI